MALISEKQDNRHCFQSFDCYSSGNSSRHDRPKLAALAVTLITADYLQGLVGSTDELAPMDQLLIELVSPAWRSPEAGMQPLPGVG